MDDRYQYLLLMAGCLLITLPLEFVLRARVYRRPRRLLLVAAAGARRLPGRGTSSASCAGTGGTAQSYTTGIRFRLACRSRRSSSSSSSRSAGCSPTRRSARCSAGCASGGVAMREYTVLAVLSVSGPSRVEVFWLRTGIFRRPSTGSPWRSSTASTCSSTAGSPSCRRRSSSTTTGEITGLRVPWDIPVEDYLFGFSMITLTLMLWVHLGDA